MYPITIRDLRITTYIYGQLSNDDHMYNRVRDISFDEVDPGKLVMLYQFLRDWKCYQFKREEDEKRDQCLLAWHSKYVARIADQKLSILDIEDRQIRSYETMVQDLMNCFASTRLKNYSASPCPRFGYAAASKALMVFCRNIFAPWDVQIIDELNLGNNGKYPHFTKDGKGYCEYLIFIKDQLKNLEKEIEMGDIHNLSIRINRPHSSLPKIINEHLWVSKACGINPRKIVEIVDPQHEMNYIDTNRTFITN